MRIISQIIVTTPKSADVDLQICPESITGSCGLCSDSTEPVCSHGTPHLENELCDSVCHVHDKKIRCVKHVQTCSDCVHVNVCIKQNNVDATMCDDFIMYRPKIVIKELE